MAKVLAMAAWLAMCAFCYGEHGKALYEGYEALFTQSPWVWGVAAFVTLYGFPIALLLRRRVLE